MAKRRNITTKEALLLTSDEVSDLCGWSRTHVHKAIQMGELPCIRIGRSVRVPRAWLEKWIEQEVKRWEEAHGKES